MKNINFDLKVKLEDKSFEITPLRFLRYTSANGQIWTKKYLLLYKYVETFNWLSHYMLSLLRFC